MEYEQQTEGRPEGSVMNRKVIFRLAPNEIEVAADQVPGAIADALYPLLPRDELEGQPLNDPNIVPRLIEERRQGKMLRSKFPNLPDDAVFSIGELSRYLAEKALVLETRIRIDTSSEPERRWLERQFIDGFNSVRDGTTESQKSHFEVSDERCLGLARSPELYVDHFIELVGIGVGQHESYFVSKEGVSFREWEAGYIAEGPKDWQKDMLRDNRTAPQLEFPCTPAKLLQFIDTAIGIHNFSVPDAFRLAVVQQATLPVSSQIAEPTAPALVESNGETPESNERPSSAAKPLPAQRFQEQEILRVIKELGYDPKGLPKDSPGRNGVKAEVRARLNFTTLVFNKAWERLSSARDICKLK